VRVTAEGTHGTNWRNTVGGEFGGRTNDELERQDFERHRVKALWTPQTLPQLKLRFTHDDQRDAQPTRPMRRLVPIIRDAKSPR
jgi:hypothetical protein